MNPELRAYLLRFLVSLAVFMGVSRLDVVVERVREPYCRLLSRTVSVGLNWIGIPSQHDYDTVTYKGGGLTVVPECDGIVLLCLFYAGVLGAPLPRTLRSRLVLVLAFFLLVGINWVRLLALALTQYFQPHAFDAAHHYVMQGMLILVTLVLYVGWLRVIEPEAQRPAPQEPEEPEAASEPRD